MAYISNRSTNAQPTREGDAAECFLNFYVPTKSRDGTVREKKIGFAALKRSDVTHRQILDFILDRDGNVIPEKAEALMAKIIVRANSAKPKDDETLAV